MNPRDKSLALLALAAALFVLWHRKRSDIDPRATSGPNANDTSEHQRDVQQAANGGWAVPINIFAPGRSPTLTP